MSGDAFGGLIFLLIGLICFIILAKRNKDPRPDPGAKKFKRDQDTFYQFEKIFKKVGLSTFEKAIKDLEERKIEAKEAIKRAQENGVPFMAARKVIAQDLSKTRVLDPIFFESTVRVWKKDVESQYVADITIGDGDGMIKKIKERFDLPSLVGHRIKNKDTGLNEYSLNGDEGKEMKCLWCIAPTLTEDSEKENEPLTESIFFDLMRSQPLPINCLTGENFLYEKGGAISEVMVKKFKCLPYSKYN